MEIISEEEEVVIVGGGIAGLATALALKRVGIRALVLERSPELRTTGAALTLFPNAWLALEALGVAHKLTSIYSPFRRGNVTNVANGTTKQVSYTMEINGKVHGGPISVHRRTLLETLAGELPPGTIRYSSKLTSIRTVDEASSSGAIVSLDDGKVIRAKVLIGCDGVHSVVARWLGLRPPVNSNRSAIRGLAVFPQGHGFKKEVYQFLDQGKRAGFVPLNNEELYWFLSYGSPLKGEEIAADPKLLQKEVMENLAKDFPPAYLEVVQHADLATLSWAPLMFRYPWDLIFGQVCKGSITVAGDAMHPMTPDLGQGGGSALEDAVVLGRHLGNSFLANPNRRIVPMEAARAIEGYVKERRWRTAGLITLSYLSGWVQQSGSGSIMKFLRDTIFYRFLYRRLFDHLQYDCGKLPSVSSSPFESDAQTKID